MNVPSWRPFDRRVVCPLLCLGFLLTVSSPVRAQTTNPVLRGLQQSDAYVSPAAISAHKARAGDRQRLLAAALTEATRGVPEKFAIASYPSTYPNAGAAASALRRLLGFSGVLVLVSPHGLGMSSDKLSRSELSTIESQSGPICLSQSYANCAIDAGQRAEAQFKSKQDSSSRNAAIFWVVVLGLLAIVVGAVVFLALGRRNRVLGRRNDMRQAANNTLAQADSAVGEIESELSTSGHSLPAEARSEYDRALGLRDQARVETERASTPEMLAQANQDAAQAVLALQGVMRRIGLNSPLVNPLDVAGHKCFYCAHEDRPPYSPRTIDDGKGNAMEVEVCSVCSQRLAQGQQPQVATINYGGTPMPWWAAPGNPYYYYYGGPSWQNWIPFMVGMELGSWMGGGYGYGGFYGDDDRGGGYGDGGDDGAGTGTDAPSDAANFDFGGYGDSGSSSGGWDGGGSGGWDGGGGGDSGGWDSGGGGGDGGWG